MLNVLGVMGSLFISIAQGEEAESPWSYEKIKKTSFNFTDEMLSSILKKGSADNLFYVPINISKTLPSDYGYDYSNVEINSSDNLKLHGWVIKSTNEKPKGVIVFSHGNTGSMNNHFGFCSWFLSAGYDVLMFDYRGYGKSEGTPSRKGLIDDVVATLNFAEKRKEWQNLPLISFGHSLGVAKSIVALELKKQTKRVKAAIFWAGFNSYVSMAETLIGKTANKIVSDDFSPINHIENVKGIPKFFIHGKKDALIPYEHTQSMFDKAQGDKSLYLTEEGGHNDALSRDNKIAQKQILAWLEKTL